MAATPTSVLADVFDVDETLIDEPHPSYNVAPTDPVPAVAVNRSGRRILRELRWGLVPSWASDDRGGPRMINARLETVLTARAFRAAFERRRCLLPADGYYEWERLDDGRKQAWFIHAEGPLAFAGIFEIWRASDQDPLLRTCAVITTAADDAMRPVHDRMPVVLPPDAWAEWIDPATDTDTALALAHAPAGLARYPVSDRVNSVRNNGPELIAPVTDSDSPPVPLRLW